MFLNYCFRRKINRRKRKAAIRQSLQTIYNLPTKPGKRMRISKTELPTLSFLFVPFHKGNPVVPAGCGTGVENSPEATDPVAELGLWSGGFLFPRSVNSSAVAFYKATDFREMQQVAAGQHSVLGNREAHRETTIRLVAPCLWPLLCYCEQGERIPDRQCCLLNPHIKKKGE